MSAPHLPRLGPPSSLASEEAANAPTAAAISPMSSRDRTPPSDSHRSGRAGDGVDGLGSLPLTPLRFGAGASAGGSASRPGTSTSTGTARAGLMSRSSKQMSRKQLKQEAAARLQKKEVKKEAKPLPDIPATSLHTELLFEAVDSKDLKSIRDLVAHSGADLAGHDWLNHAGRSAMHRGVQVADPDVVKVLVEVGGDVNVQDSNGMSPVHLACRRGDLACLRELLASPTLDLSVGALGKGHTALHITAVHGHPTLAQTLIDAGADVNAQNLAGETALHMAALHNQLPVAEVLVRAGAHLMIKTHQFRHVPLHYATQVGSKDVAHFLQDQGVTVHVPEREGVRSALDLACSFGHHQLGGALLKKERARRETAEARRRAQELKAEQDAIMWMKEEKKRKILRARERVLAKRAAERAAWKKEEEERMRADAERAVAARKSAMARVRKLAKERKAKEEALNKFTY